MSSGRVVSFRGMLVRCLQPPAGAESTKVVCKFVAAGHRHPAATKAVAEGLTPTCPRPTVPPGSPVRRDYLMDRLSAPSECRAQALHCRMVADTVMDEQVRALWVSMAHSWTKLAEAIERLQPDQGTRGADGEGPR
jgi:hypothetical protein